MNRRYLYFTFIICVIALLRFTSEFFSDCYPATTPAIPDCGEFANAEKLLAHGKRLNLASANEYDLGLISGLSATMAQRIAEKRTQIVERAKTLPEDKKVRALELVHGIGEKKAMQFGKYLKFE